MDTNIIIRPHGKMYVVGLIIMYAFFWGLLSFSILFILDKLYWALLVEIPPIICLILQTREVVNCKLELTGTKIHMSAQRELFITRQKESEISYKDIKSIQYLFGIISWRFGLASAIKLNYDDEKFEYFEATRFSEKQIGTIMDYIVKFAEQYNGYPIEVLPDQIQKGFGPRKRYNNKHNAKKRERLRK